MPPVACNPVLTLSSEEKRAALTSNQWCLIWAEGIQTALGQELSLHRFLVIPLPEDKVILFSIISDVEKRKSCYERTKKNKKIAGLFSFKKEAFPENTFDGNESVADLNNHPIERKIEDIIDYRFLMLDCLNKEEKERILGYLLDREDITRQLKNLLTTIYCSL